jgi:hypothetical protein
MKREINGIKPVIVAGIFFQERKRGFILSIAVKTQSNLVSSAEAPVMYPGIFIKEQQVFHNSPVNFSEKFNDQIQK